MDNDLRIPDIYPVNFSKTLTLKVNNITITKPNDTPVGYSFTVEDDYGFIANFDQYISIHPLHSQKIIVTASVGMLRYRRMVDQDLLINGCIGLLPPGNKLLEYCIIDAYDELRAHMGMPFMRIHVEVKWPERSLTTSK